MNGLLKNNFFKKHKIEYIKYIINNEEYFINILDKFNNDYSTVPYSINFLPFLKNENIDSILAFTKNGQFYPFIKHEYIKKTSDFINKRLPTIFSIYGYSSIINNLINLINHPPRYCVVYYVMKLSKKSYIPLKHHIKNYFCIPCNNKHFIKLKKLQYLYHKEEVYGNDSFYPYDAEMNAFKKVLKSRINYAVFTDEKNPKPVSKVNINGESPNFYQIGGIFTKKDYRDRGLSKLCLTHLLDHIFSENKKEKVILFVKKNNLPAVNLYLKFGFDILYESTLCYY